MLAVPKFFTHEAPAKYTLLHTFSDLWLKQPQKHLFPKKLMLNSLAHTLYKSVH